MVREVFAPAAAPRRSWIRSLIFRIEGRFAYNSDQLRLFWTVIGEKFGYGTIGQGVREMWMFPQTLAIELLMKFPVTLAFLGIVASVQGKRGEELLKFVNAMGRSDSPSVFDSVRNHADWGVLHGLLAGQLDALYVRASAERGEFSRPSPAELERLLKHAAAVGARARAWELDLPKPYLWARRVVGLALGIGWFHILFSGLDLLDLAGDAVAHGIEGLQFLRELDAPHVAALFDLDAMLDGGSVAESSVELPDPQGYGLPSLVDGDPRVNPVSGYFRDDGTFVRAYWRGARG